jgi:hypothetical protein
VAAGTERTRVSRAATHLVVGIDEGIAGTVFGTMTAMATVTAYGKAFPDSPWKLEELVLSTALVLWVAHIYAHALSESISERRPLRPHVFRAIARRERGILLAAVPPLVVLTLGTFGLFGESTSIWLALAVGLVTLGLEGWRYARLEQLHAPGTLVAVAANVGLGLLVVLLKVSVLH